MSPYEFINKIFESKTSKSGGVVRRSVSDIEQLASSQYLIKEVRARGFHLIEGGGHYVIICNSGRFSVLC